MSLWLIQLQLGQTLPYFWAEFPVFFVIRYGHTGEIWRLLLQALPHWKLENSPPVEEKKQINPEGKKKEDKEKYERKSTKSDKGQSQDKLEKESKSKDKDKDKEKEKGSIYLNQSRFYGYLWIFMAIALFG